MFNFNNCCKKQGNKYVFRSICRMQIVHLFHIRNRSCFNENHFISYLISPTKKIPKLTYVQQLNKLLTVCIVDLGRAQIFATFQVPHSFTISPLTTIVLFQSNGTLTFWCCRPVKLCARTFQYARDPHQAKTVKNRQCDDHVTIPKMS